jgi:hypothetical protein
MTSHFHKIPVNGNLSLDAEILVKLAICPLGGWYATMLVWSAGQELAAL